MKFEPTYICKFNEDGYCIAMACYTIDDCGARDDNGNPKYK